MSCLLLRFVSTADTFPFKALNPVLFSCIVLSVSGGIAPPLGIFEIALTTNAVVAALLELSDSSGVIKFIIFFTLS